GEESESPDSDEHGPGDDEWSSTDYIGEAGPEDDAEDRKERGEGQCVEECLLFDAELHSVGHRVRGEQALEQRCGEADADGGQEGDRLMADGGDNGNSCLG